MTQLRKSDAQLDAEAAAPTRSLEDAIAEPHQIIIEWQAALDAEPTMRITGRHPALIVDADNQALIEASKVGMDLTEAMIEWVDAGFPIKPASQQIGARGRNPVHDALLLWERKCRKEHARWADHRGRPVCAEIAWAVIRDRTNLQWAAEFTGVSFARAERLLALAIGFMHEKQGRWFDNEEVIIPARTPAEWMAAPHQHKSIGGLHAEECPVCLRVA